jgi:uncharacterized protein YggE
MRARLLALPAGAVLLVGAGAAGFSLAGSAAAATNRPYCGANQPTLTAHGSGSAAEAPDLLTVVVSVQTDAATAQAALQENDAGTARVLNAFRSAGVPSVDLQTSNLQISPNYSGTPTPYITGYDVQNTVTAMVTHLATAGIVIDRAAAAAGDAIRIQSLSFSVAHDGGLQSQARAAGLRVAAQEAQAMAQAAGEHLGGLCSVTDTVTQQPVPTLFGDSLAAHAGVAAVPLAPGQQQDTAQVTAVYALNR